MMSVILSLKNISKNFSNVTANDNISFAVKENSIHALLGENGAGKSTLVKIIQGSYQASSGEMFWQGKAFKPRIPSDSKKHKIAMVFQHFSLFESLSVIENIALGLDFERVDNNFRQKVLTLSQQYGLHIDLDHIVGDLSAGVRQRIEIIRCLLQNPKLLIMDEPTSVLTPIEIDNLFKILHTLKDNGCSILYISHKLGEISQLCDTATILRKGKVIKTCDIKNVNKYELAEMMIGKKIISPSRKKPIINNEVLSIQNLNYKSSTSFGIDLKNITLSLHKGSVTGIAGIAGNGQNELMQVLIGEEKSEDNAIILNSVDISHFSPSKRRQNGMFFVPEQRLGHATVPSFTLAQNMLLSRSRDNNMMRFGLIKKPTISNLAKTVINSFNVKTQSQHSMAKVLSGGNLQKFILGRELIQQPQILIIEQPTWGVDMGAANHIHQNLIELANAGVAILIISQDLDEILSLSDKIYVLTNGKLSSAINVQGFSNDTLVYTIGSLMEKTEIMTS